MLNDGINNVPDNKIVVFNKIDANIDNLEERSFNLLSKLPKKRDWFTPHFYNCLPLVIGNQYGFAITSEFDFTVHWNGEDNPEALQFEFNEELGETNKKIPRVVSHFGSGIMTIESPFIIRTPPGINLMTINPPNYVLPNMTVMTGVVETDNLRFTFTFNIKIQIPGISVHIPKGTPLAAFIPIQRGTVEKYDIVLASDIFKDDVIDEEMKAYEKAHKERLNQKYTGVTNRQYFKGVDTYGNSFPNFHQGPTLTNKD
jgi:hypothetical protein